MQKFENMDVIAALETIMHQNTAYYQSDFAYDIKMLREAARSDQPEDKTASKSTRTCRFCRMAMRSLRMRMGT